MSRRRLLRPLRRTTKSDQLSGADADVLYEAIPVWVRAYAVSETKRCVEGAAGTRGADKAIAEVPSDKKKEGVDKPPFSMLL